MKHLPFIVCSVIPHKEQRYDTAGDYYKTCTSDWQFLISKMENSDYEFMVLVHELVEWYLTQKHGIKEKDITYFDTHEGKYSDDPGTMKSAPYHKEHMFSTRIEKMICKELGLDWKEYDNSFAKLKWQ